MIIRALKQTDCYPSSDIILCACQKNCFQGSSIMTSQPNYLLTPEEYLATERKADTKASTWMEGCGALAGAAVNVII